MRVLIRADASQQIGSGHAMRCLTLAQELSRGGDDVAFVTRVVEEGFWQHIERQGFKIHCLPPAMSLEPEIDFLRAISHDGVPIDWLIVDHYRIDVRWEMAVRPFIRQLMVIDDLADRVHECDVLLDQNLYDGFQQRYDALVPEHCRKLLGPKYALIRDEFRSEHQAIRERTGSIDRLLVFFGGADHSNETTKVLKALQVINRPDLAVDVVIGAMNPYRLQVQGLVNSLPGACLHVQTDRMAELMAKADLSIGAGGATTWERFYLGLPSVVISTADNQVVASSYLSSLGLHTYLGSSAEVSIESIVSALTQLFRQPQALLEQSRRGRALLDGSGAQEIRKVLHKGGICV